jgi:hypothetical protein
MELPVNLKYHSTFHLPIKSFKRWPSTGCLSAIRHRNAVSLHGQYGISYYSIQNPERPTRSLESLTRNDTSGVWPVSKLFRQQKNGTCTLV